jgi:YHS domain-containing protein
MVFGLFARKDPICGMKEVKNKGAIRKGKWFCSEACVKAFESGTKKPAQGSCCGGH